MCAGEALEKLEKQQRRYVGVSDMCEGEAPASGKLQASLHYRSKFINLNQNRYVAAWHRHAMVQIQTALSTSMLL